MINKKICKILRKEIPHPEEWCKDQVNPTHSQYAAQKIPNAKVIALESGGYIFMGQHERVRSETTKFLKQHAIAG